MSTAERLRFWAARGEALLARWRTVTDERFGLTPSDVAALSYGDDLTPRHPPGGLHRIDMNAWVTAWAQDGCPTFTVTHGLESALLLTECDHVRVEDARLPYDAFAVVLPAPSALSLGPATHGLTARAPVLWIRLHRHVTLVDVSKVRLPALGASRRAALSALRSATSHLTQHVKWGIQIATPDDTLIYDAPVPPPGTDIETWLKLNATGRTGDAASYENEATHHHTIAATMRLLVNLGLYVAEQTHDATLPELRSNGPGSVRGAVLGREIKLPRELRESARAYVERGIELARWTVASRFTVRGHWQHYYVGEGRAERVARWKQPYAKGPADGPVLPRNYVVDLKETL